MTQRMKLGKLDPKPNDKGLLLSKYLTGELPLPADRVWREYKVPEVAKQMYGNDRFGDCVWAMSANALILASCHTGPIVIPSIQNVLDAYSAVTGFNQQTGANDNGTAITDALEYLRITGLAGHKILAWAKIDHTNLLHRRIATDLFGMTLIGVQLPQNAQEQFAAGQSFEVSSTDSQIEGGHAMLHAGYGSLGDDYVTWAKWDQKASAAWSAKFVDEEYVIITPDWFNRATQKTPGGIDLATLEADMKLISA